MSVGDEPHSAARSETLDALLACLIPTDEAPGARDLGLGPAVCARVPAIAELLEQLEGFAVKSADEQDLLLRRLTDDNDPVLAAVVQAAHETYYSDPRSWQSLGYTTHLPGRP